MRYSAIVTHFIFSNSFFVLPSLSICPIPLFNASLCSMVLNRRQPKSATSVFFCFHSQPDSRHWQNNVGENLFYFYRALLQQLNTGPRDAVTGKARYTLDSSTLLQTELTGKAIVSASDFLQSQSCSLSWLLSAFLTIVFRTIPSGLWEIKFDACNPE